MRLEIFAHLFDMITLTTKMLRREIKQYTRKRKFLLFYQEKPFDVSTVSYWDGGSRSDWRSLSNGAVNPAPAMTTPPQFGGKQVHVEVNEKNSLFDCGITSGKPAILKLYCCNLSSVLIKGHLEELIEYPDLIARLRAGL